MLELNEKKKIAYLSENACDELRNYITGLGYEIYEVKRSGAVYDEVAAHPDIYMCKLGAEPCAPIYHGTLERLGYKYPENIRYNAAVCGHYFIHNLKHTDSELLEAAKVYVSKKYEDEAENHGELGGKYNMQEIHTAQGYTKCNIVVVDDTHLITEDAGIAKAIEMAMWRERNLIGRGSGERRKAERDMFEKRRLNVLLVSPKQVILDGFPHGFLGGASGRLENTIIFNGDITKHTDYERIKAFIEEAGLEIKYFDYPLTDIGSIITMI